MIGNEKAYLSDCIDSGWISSEGPYVVRFEEAVATYVGRKHAVSVSNGTAALDLALSCLNLKEGDEVILPTFTIISCITAILRAGAVPVLVDCDPVTFNMNPKEVASRVTARTRGIMVVHIYGLPCEMDALEKIASENELFIIEDAAEMIGQTYKGKKCGSFGKLSILSFYANKTITTGEGGMVLTDDTLLAEKLNSAKNLCFQKKRFVHEDLGWNYRMTNLQAAVGLAQMEKLDELVSRKRHLGKRYNELLKGTPGLRLPLHQTDYSENIYWVYPVVTEDDCKLSAGELAFELGKRKIATRPFFWPMHEQPALEKYHLSQGRKFPAAEMIARKGLYLPGGTGTTEEEVVAVSEAVRELLS